MQYLAKKNTLYSGYEDSKYYYRKNSRTLQNASSEVAQIIQKINKNEELTKKQIADFVNQLIFKKTSGVFNNIYCSEDKYPDNNFFKNIVAIINYLISNNKLTDAQITRIFRDTDKYCPLDCLICKLSSNNYKLLQEQINYVLETNCGYLLVKYNILKLEPKNIGKILKESSEIDKSFVDNFSENFKNIRTVEKSTIISLLKKSLEYAVFHFKTMPNKIMNNFHRFIVNVEKREIYSAIMYPKCSNYNYTKILEITIDMFPLDTKKDENILFEILKHSTDGWENNTQKILEKNNLSPTVNILNMFCDIPNSLYRKEFCDLLMDTYEVIPDQKTLELLVRNKNYYQSGEYIEKMINRYKLNFNLTCLENSLSGYVGCDFIKKILENRVIPTKECYEKLCVYSERMGRSNYQLKMYRDTVSLLIEYGLLIDEELIMIAIKYNRIIPNHDKYGVKLTEKIYYQIQMGVGDTYTIDSFKIRDISDNVLKMREKFKSENHRELIRFMKDNKLSPDGYCYKNSMENSDEEVLKIFIKNECVPPIECLGNHNKIISEQYKKMLQIPELWDKYVIREIQEI